MKKDGEKNFFFVNCFDAAKFSLLFKKLWWDEIMRLGYLKSVEFIYAMIQIYTISWLQIKFF